MSVNAVSGTSLQKDLVSALRQARAANARPVDADTFASAAQDTGSSQSASSTSQSGSTASTPAVSNDLMASLLQLQSDFSQLSLQNGVTSPTEPADASATAATSGATDTSQAASQTASDATPVQHHHGHHHRPTESDAADSTQSGQASGASDTSSATGSSTTGDASSTDSLGSSLDAFLQQVTKAITAYASGGPVGVAAAALTSSTKA